MPGLPPAEMGHAGSSAEKRCSKCGAVNPISGFSPQKDARDGLRASCRTCQDVAAKERYRKDPEKYRKASREWAKAHPEEVKRKAALYSNEHREQLNERRRELHALEYQQNREQILEKNRRWREANPDKVAALNRLWRKNNPERAKANHLRYRDSHREQINARNAKWAAANPDKRTSCSAVRRARKNGNKVGDLAAINSFRKKVYSKLKIRCYWCREYVLRKDRHIDHIVPLAKGGPHAEWNLCCACGTCNDRKGAKDPSEFSGQGELCLLPEQESRL